MRSASGRGLRDLFEARVAHRGTPAYGRRRSSTGSFLTTGSAPPGMEKLSGASLTGPEHDRKPQLAAPALRLWHRPC